MEYDQLDNAFAEWGSWGHKVLEMYYKRELEIFELYDTYVNGYNENVKTSMPPNKYVDLDAKYFKAGEEYFLNFDDPFRDYEVLDVEKEFEINIGKYKFTGFIDLILRNHNGITIVDHKSKSGFKSKKEIEDYLRQLYLYSIFVFKKYRVYPYELIFNMFRANDIVRQPFNEKAYENAKRWFNNEIEKIYADTEFKPNPSEFFCDWVCGVRHQCRCSNKYLGE